MPTCRKTPTANETSIEAAGDLLLQAERPLILIGAAANRKQVSAALSRLIEEREIPFITTQMGKGVVDERSDWYIGNAALSSGDFVHLAARCADVILNVGHETVEKPPFLMQAEGGMRMIHLNYGPAQVEPVYFSHVEVTGDIADALDRLNRRLDAPRTWNTEAFLEIRNAALRPEMAARPTEKTMSSRQIANHLRTLLPTDAVLCLDNGLYKIFFARDYPAYLPNTVLLDNALATMGAGLPSAMATKIAYPERAVVAICGDGGFLMNAQELETAVRLGLNLVILVLRDDSYGMIRWKQDAMGFQAYGLDFGNPDFVQLAHSYGAKGHRVESLDHLAELLPSLLGASGVHLLDVPIDYEQDRNFIDRELPQRVREMESETPCSRADL